MPEAALLDSPLAGAEFLAVDTETNGQPKERCELTEVGAVLVGGGELHERWSSLVGVSAPLGRGIQRFTGITQAMVDEAPPPEQVLPELAEQLRGRILVAHNARFDVGVLRRRSSAPSSNGRTRRCCARSRWRAGWRRCSAAAGWPRWPTRSGSRSTSRTARCPTRRRARACSARCCRGCARTRARWRRRWRCCGRAARRGRPARRRRARATTGPTCRRCPRTPASTSSATPTAGRSTSASRSACARARARTSRRPRPGPARPSTSTTSRPSPSSARSCSRTG